MEDGITVYSKVSISVLLLCLVEIFRVIEGITVSIDIKIWETGFSESIGEQHKEKKIEELCKKLIILVEDGCEYSQLN